MRSVLVTGGAGYIGSHTCKALTRAGYHPVAFDNLCLGHRRFVKWGPLVEADILDMAALASAIDHYRPVGIIHLAAFAYVGESVTDPSKYYRNNVVGTLSLLDAACATGLKPIVFSSTCAVYGAPDVELISEQTVAHPINPYGHSKLMCEEMLKDYASAYGLRSIALRYFNASGADPDGDVGEDRAMETHIIPRALRAAQGRLPEFAIYGCDFPTPDGTAVRDYIHVTDLAVAHVRALDALLCGHRGGCFNLGSGTGYSVRQVVDTVSRVVQRPIQAKRAPRRPGDPSWLVADARLARDILGIQPERSSLQTIIEDAWRWQQHLEV